MRTRIKICCISSKEEAQLAIRSGADALGLVGHMPSGPGVISDELIFEITKSIPPPVSTFLLTSETSAEKIIAHHQAVQTSTIQLVDSVEIITYEILRKALPGIKLVQVIHILDKKTILEAVQISRFVDCLLLDSGNPNLAVKELGGTGRTHNWALSKKIRQEIDIPLFLAGGLNAGNIKQAIETVQPFGVDLCSSVRTNGLLNVEKLKTFMSQIPS